MPTISRWFFVAAVPISACNIQVSSPDRGDATGHGATRLPAPGTLSSISLDGAVQLSWDGLVVTNHPAKFDHYRVYSTSYAASTNRCEESAWVLEGTTVSDGFLVSNVRNGVTRCFAVSTVAQDGGEGPRGLARTDTPRHGGKFVVVDAFDSRPSSAEETSTSGSNGMPTDRSGFVRSDRASDCSSTATFPFRTFRRSIARH
jgi:hypothetical protein